MWDTNVIIEQDVSCFVLDLDKSLFTMCLWSSMPKEKIRRKKNPSAA